MSARVTSGSALALGGVPLDRAFAALKKLEPHAHACWIYDLDQFAARARRFRAGVAALNDVLAQLFLSGNTRVNRGVDQPSSTTAPTATSSLWTGLGFGFEQRSGFLDFSLVGNIVFTSTSFTPHWAVHGGIGIGF